MNESEQYHGESETFRNKYEALLYYMRAVFHKIIKEPTCSPAIKDQCSDNILLINQLLVDYDKWYNMGYGNGSIHKHVFNVKDRAIKKLLTELNEIDIFEH